MAGDCIKVFVLLLTIEFGASDTIINEVHHYKDKIDFEPCKHSGRSGNGYQYSKNDPSFGTGCAFYVKGSQVNPNNCPFDNTHLEGDESAGTLSITSFHPGNHSGYWTCGAIGSTTYNLTGYAFATITHTITKQVIEGKTKLECNLAHYYPSICDSKSGEECDNRADSLRWFKETENELIELDADSLETSNDTQYEGLYQTNSTLTLTMPESGKLEFKDYEYRCVYQNFNGNRSTAFYPRPQVAVEPIAIGVGIVLVIIVIIIVTIYIIKKKKQQNEDAEAHVDKDQSKNVEL